MSAKKESPAGTPPASRHAPARTLRASDISRIRELAYACYSARLGSGSGDELSDWLEAERMYFASLDTQGVPEITPSKPAPPARVEKAESRAGRPLEKRLSV